jgi:putative spermidine/putrescine transport system permease protein
VFVRLINGLAWFAVLFIVAPLVVIFAGSFTTTPYVAFPPIGFTLRWYEQLMHNQDFLLSFIDSLLIATLCTIGATLLGVLAAVALHRYVFFGRAVFHTLLMSPLVLPTIVTGIALLQFYYLVHIIGSLGGLVIGHLVITIPYVIRTVGAGLVRLDEALEEAAECLGAGPVRILFRVTLPAIAPAILASVIFVFITSFDQATVSIFLSTPYVTPLPVRIYTYIDLAVDPMIAAVSTLLIIFAFALIALLQKLFGLERAFGIQA